MEPSLGEATFDFETVLPEHRDDMSRSLNQSSFHIKLNGSHNAIDAKKVEVSLGTFPGDNAVDEKLRTSW